MKSINPIQITICFWTLRGNFAKYPASPQTMKTNNFISNTQKNFQHILKSMYPILIGFLFRLFGGYLLNILGAAPAKMQKTISWGKRSKILPNLMKSMYPIQISIHWTGGLQSDGLQSRSTDFVPGIALTGLGAYRLGAYSLGAYSLGVYSLWSTDSGPGGALARSKEDIEDPLTWTLLREQYLGTFNVNVV